MFRAERPSLESFQRFLGFFCHFLYLDQMKNILSVFSLLYAQLTSHTMRKRILLTLEIIYSGPEKLLLYFN